MREMARKQTKMVMVEYGCRVVWEYLDAKLSLTN